jgi:hypothetical protein
MIRITVGSEARNFKHYQLQCGHKVVECDDVIAADAAHCITNALLEHANDRKGISLSLRE